MKWDEGLGEGGRGEYSAGSPDENLPCKVGPQGGTKMGQIDWGKMKLSPKAKAYVSSQKKYCKKDNKW